MDSNDTQLAFARPGASTKVASCLAVAELVAVMVDITARSSVSSCRTYDDVLPVLVACSDTSGPGSSATPWLVARGVGLVVTMKSLQLLSVSVPSGSVSYTHLRAHETRHDLVC